MSGRTGKQEQERISPNHVPTIFHFSVLTVLLDVDVVLLTQLGVQKLPGKLKFSKKIMPTAYCLPSLKFARITILNSGIVIS